jgi:hypothetical protein
MTSWRSAPWDRRHPLYLVVVMKVWPLVTTSVVTVVGAVGNAGGRKGGVFQGLGETGTVFHSPAASTTGGLARQAQSKITVGGKGRASLKPRACPADRPPALFAKAGEYPRPESLHDKVGRRRSRVRGPQQQSTTLQELA